MFPQAHNYQNSPVLDRYCLKYIKSFFHKNKYKWDLPHVNGYDREDNIDYGNLSFTYAGNATS